MRIRIDPLDVLFSTYIRTKAGWKCEMCFKQYHPPTASLQCSHFKGRRNKSTRWEPENCAALCFSCHRRVTEDPEFHRNWFLKRLGEERYNALILKANSYGKPDKKLLKIWLTQSIKNLERDRFCESR